jgi:hypothetical protein
LIQGLIKKNENYLNILEILQKSHYDYGFFVFGNVDLSFYFYISYEKNEKSSKFYKI